MNTPGSIFILSLLFFPASSVDMSTGKCKSEDDNSCKDPSAFHGEADEETNLLQTAVEINKHQETLVSKERKKETLMSLMQQTLSGSVSPEASLIQAVKLSTAWITKEDIEGMDWGNYVEDMTPGIIGQPGPDPPAQCPTDPEIAKNLQNSYPNIPEWAGMGEGDACCSVWRRKGFCKGQYENWLTANCAMACCDLTPIFPGTTIIGHPGTSCDETCAAVEMKCDEVRLQSVDTEEEVLQVAGEAFVSCNGTDDYDYWHSPSLCTNAEWCKGNCSYGLSRDWNSHRGNCSYKGYSFDKWSRFCPCRDLSAAEAEAAAEYAATRAAMLGKPKETCDETCSHFKFLMNGTLTTTCRCRNDHACTSSNHHTSWCYIDSMDSCSDSVQGGGGPWSEEACSAGGGVCDDDRLQGVDTSAEVLELAGDAGISCSSEDEISYAYSPSQYTGTLVEMGSTKFSWKIGVCYYGKNSYVSGERNCSITPEDGYQRLCPCMMSESLLSEHAKSKKDKKGTKGKK
jgi:hypothetical protein